MVRLGQDGLVGQHPAVGILRGEALAGEALAAPHLNHLRMVGRVDDGHRAAGRERIRTGGLAVRDQFDPAVEGDRPLDGAETADQGLRRRIVAYDDPQQRVRLPANGGNVLLTGHRNDDAVLRPQVAHLERPIVKVGHRQIGAEQVQRVRLRPVDAAPHGEGAAFGVHGLDGGVERFGHLGLG